eukprot:9619845-Alexandrium_andersonii.AAC.1
MELPAFPSHRTTPPWARVELDGTQAHWEGLVSVRGHQALQREEAVAEERDEPLRRVGEPHPRELPWGSLPLARGLGGERS